MARRLPLSSELASHDRQRDFEYMDFVIRPATCADAPHLTALAQTAKASWGYPAAWLEVWRNALTITPSYIEMHAVVVAEALAPSRSVIGMCALEDGEEHWQIAHLWIAPHAQRAGIGRALVQHVVATAGSHKPGRVVRAEADPYAADFYRRLGACEVATVPAPMDGAPTRVLPVFELATPAG